LAVYGRLLNFPGTTRDANKNWKGIIECKSVSLKRYIFPHTGGRTSLQYKIKQKRSLPHGSLTQKVKRSIGLAFA